MDLRAITLGILFALMWSSAFTSARIIVAEAPPILSLALRFALSGALGVALALATGETLRLNRAQWRTVIVFGICQNALYLGLNFVAMQRIEASLAAIVASALPLTVALANWVLFAERTRLLGVVGLLAGSAGVLLIMGTRLQGGADPAGLALCIGGVVALTSGRRSWVRGAAIGGAAAWLPPAGVAGAQVGLEEWAVRGAGALIAAVALWAGRGTRHRSRREASSAIVGRSLTGWAVTAIIVALVAAVSATEADETRLLDRLPTGGVAVRSADLPLSEVEAAHLSKAEAVKRRYRVPAGAFDLLAVDGRGDRHAVHDPSYCHLGDGWSEIDRQFLPLPGGRAVRVRYGRAGERTEAVFWFSDGRRRSASAAAYWWWATARRLTLGRSGPEPVLVVLQPVGPRPPDWVRALGQMPALAAM